MGKVFDVIIIGGGIAAYTAAVYTSRSEFRPLVITGKGLDQLSTTNEVENYPGFPKGIMGPELIQSVRKQAERFGTSFLREDVVSLKRKSGGYEVKAGGKSYTSRTVIICTGASARKMGIPGEEKFWAKGVSTCAPCDAPLFRDKIVTVVGGGDSAMEEAITLAKFAKKVIIIHRRDELRATKIMQERVFKTKNISIIWDSVVTDVFGEVFVKGVKVKNVKTGKKSEVKCDGMFLAIGHIPNTNWLKGSGLKLDKKGYIPGVVTNLPGVFAAGDVMDSRYRQAVTSAGTGCQAALEAEKYIENLKTTGKY